VPIDGPRGDIQPLPVGSQIFEFAGGEIFLAVGRGPAQRAKQLGSHQHWDVMRLESQEGGGLWRIQPGWQAK
jgi:hypothetical protein